MRNAGSLPFWTAAGLAAALAAACAAPIAAAEHAADGGLLRLEASPRSSLWLAGDSTLHAYQSTATVLRVSMEVARAEPEGSPVLPGAPGEVPELLREGAVRSLRVEVPVARMRSGKKGLDEKMQEALDAKKHPSVIFTMRGYTIPEPAAARAELGEPFAVRLEGDLSLAGEARPVVLETQVEVSGRSVRARGSKRLLMSEFGVDPPSMFFGTLKTEDAVTVHFDVQMVPVEETP